MRIMRYDHKEIEAKWQKRWEEAGVFCAKDSSKKKKFYALVEFPYPSGAGLHIGHPRSYVAMDVLARKRRMEGMNVLYPIGWDAFGLPTENFAIKTGRKPQEVTEENVAIFRRQLQSLGISFDWSREVNTTDPSYYKWTQWMFLEFWKAGLAYKAKTEINWCPSCKIGLANEEAVGGVCERCGGAVEKREKEQWMIAITKYADRLLDDLNTVDYLPKIKKQQEDWIGRSEGVEIDFMEEITVFTTRPDTIFGATYLVLAPEHPLVSKITTEDNRLFVGRYVLSAKAKTDIERADTSKEKTGVFTGAYAINPATKKEIPIWVADYVLNSYGTGAIMAVPAHDTRDWEFAKKYNLLVQYVVSRNGDVADGSYEGDGVLINSGDFNGLSVADATTKIVAWLEKEKIGRRKTTYKLRDWVFSRQRYWGEPIPLVYCEKDGWVPLPENQLPLVLPDVEKYQPTDTGESPLATIYEWVNTVCPKCGGSAKRETDTMPNWAGSSWYFLRYIDSKNDVAFADLKKLTQWMPVDWYNGGMEHTTLHLLYSRFWNKFLFDRGLVPTSEPYAKRTSHGLILAEDGTKMSKSKGNVVNPDEIVREFGADALRLLILFIGPFAEPAPWKRDGLVGMRRFIEKVMRLPEFVADDEPMAVIRCLHKTIKKVGEDIESMAFNTAVSSLMIFVNETTSAGKITKDTMKMFLRVLSPFASHVSEEVWANIGGEGLVAEAEWPKYDATLVVDDTVTIGVQVDGRVRGDITIAITASESEAKTAAEANENVAKYLEGKTVLKFVYIPGKIVNFVLKS